MSGISPCSRASRRRTDPERTVTAVKRSRRSPEQGGPIPGPVIALSTMPEPSRDRRRGHREPRGTPAVFISQILEMSKTIRSRSCPRPSRGRGSTASCRRRTWGPRSLWEKMVPLAVQHGVAGFSGKAASQKRAGSSTRLPWRSARPRLIRPSLAKFASTRLLFSPRRRPEPSLQSPSGPAPPLTHTPQRGCLSSGQMARPVPTGQAKHPSCDLKPAEALDPSTIYCHRHRHRP
jgi:hypothetical protein